jgi:hypothetical protein
MTSWLPQLIENQYEESRLKAILEIEGSLLDFLNICALFGGQAQKKGVRVRVATNDTSLEQSYTR